MEAAIIIDFPQSIVRGRNFRQSSPQRPLYKSVRREPQRPTNRAWRHILAYLKNTFGQAWHAQLTRLYLSRALARAPNPLHTLFTRYK